MLKNISAAFTSSGFETAPYESVEKQEKFEERLYPARKWVSITIETSEREEAVSKGFYPLFKYISGKNDRNAKIEMTTPVTTRTREVSGKKSFTISFFIPSPFQDDPPLPSDENVFIEERPTMRVWTRTFGGYANNKQWKDETEHLKEAIAEKTSLCDCSHFTAGYDAPFKVFNRRNEVWMGQIEESKLNL